MTTHTPLSNKIIIKRDKSTKTLGSLGIIQTSEKTAGRPLEGVVIAVGEGLINQKNGMRMPMQTKIDDRVTFPPHSGNKIPGTDDDWILPETDILAVL